MKQATHVVLLAVLVAAAPGQGAQPPSRPEAREAGAATGGKPAGAGHGAAISGDATDDRLVPSEASGDDCSADAGIDAVPDEAMRRLHARLCEAAVQPEHRASCAGLAEALPSIRFVTDHCAGPGQPLEVSLGGRPYRVLRIGAAPGENAPVLAGTFSGDGLRMQVQPGRVIGEHLDDGERIGVEQEVVVTLTLGVVVRILPAVYSDGP